MHDVRKTCLLAKELKEEIEVLKQYLELINTVVFLPELEKLIKDFQEFSRGGYLDFIINLKLVKLFNKMEAFFKQIIEMKTNLLELAKTSSLKLPELVSSPKSANTRKFNLLKNDTKIDRFPVLNLFQLFVDFVPDKTLEEVQKTVLEQKIARKRNQILEIHSEIEINKKNGKSLDLLKYLKTGKKQEIDVMVNAKPILPKRHFSMPQKLNVEKLERLCQIQQKKIDESQNKKFRNFKFKIADYSHLMDLSHSLLNKQLEDRRDEMFEREFKMILARRKISMYYEDNQAIVDDLKKKIKETKRSNYRKWIQLKKSAKLEKSEVNNEIIE